jgi:hypothetical protein
MIALDVALQFRLPVLRVGLGGRGVLWAPMPEATINEDGHLGASEDYVRRPSQ